MMKRPLSPAQDEELASLLRAVGRKQRADNAAFVHLAARAPDLVPPARVDALVAEAAGRVRALARGGRVAYAWSAGKDSQALRVVCEAAGVRDCVFGMTAGLEYPAMLRFVTENMPEGLTVDLAPLDLDWLARNPEMLFPRTAAIAGRWFKLIQHRAQDRYARARRLDRIILGRRRADGNFVGPPGQDTYARDGLIRVSPLADWSHADVLATCVHRRMALAPCYGWPNGYVVGTGAWPARQYTGNIENGFDQVWSIDPDIIRRAAAELPAAAAWIRRRGRQ